MRRAALLAVPTALLTAPVVTLAPGTHAQPLAPDLVVSGLESEPGNPALGGSANLALEPSRPAVGVAMLAATAALARWRRDPP